MALSWVEIQERAKVFAGKWVGLFLRNSRTLTSGAFFDSALPDGRLTINRPSAIQAARANSGGSILLPIPDTREQDAPSTMP
jgi:hypothetical protein